MAEWKKEIGLTVVVPAYNEASKIRGDLSEISHYLSSAGISYEIIVVDDGSTDMTGQAVEEFCKANPAIIYLRNEANRGKGYAVKRGVLAGNGRYISFIDAGLCVPPADIGMALDYLSRGYDIAIGSRGLPESCIVRKQSWYRRLGARVFARIAWRIMGLSEIKDTQCGFKFFRRDVARDLFSSLATAGFMFDVELLRRAVKRGYRIKQFAVTWSNDPDSRYRVFSGSLRISIELLKIRLAGD